MADLAELGIRIRSEEAAVADERLDDLAASAMRAEAATEQLGSASRASGAGVAVMTSAVRQQSAVMAASRMSMGLTAAEGLNLSRQFTDIGVTAAMGMNPLLIAIQQGPQVLDTFQMAAARTGTSVTAAMNAAAAATWRAMAPFLPLIATVGAAAALIGGSLALSTRALNRQFGDLTEGMGLTEEQLEKVQNRGVTMGDVVGGTLTYLRDIIWDKVGPSIEKIGEWFSDAMDWTTRKLVEATKAITGGFVGSFRAIKAVWGDLPAVMGDVAVSAANNTIRAIESMINAAVDGMNLLLMAAKARAASDPAWAWASALPAVARADLGELDNPNAGAARRAGREWATEYSAGMAEGSAIVDRNLAAVATAIRNAAQNRIRGEAGEAETERAGGGSGSSAADRVRAVREELAKIENINLRPLNIGFVELVDPLKVIADELRLIDDLAHDTARGLSSAFGENGRALGDLLTALSGYQSRLAEIDLAEREYRLNAVQADRERAMAQVQNYGDMAAAARGFFREGSDGYQALLAIEQVYRAFQLASMIQAMALGQQETASSVANSMARGAASTAAGAAKMFEALGPWAFPAVAAMLGLLAGLGLGSGGGGRSKPAAANDNADPDASTAAVRAFSARDAQSRDAAASAIAAKVDVRVSADKDGIHAYVAGVAHSQAVNVAAPLAVATAAGTKRDTLATLSDRQAGNRKVAV